MEVILSLGIKNNLIRNDVFVPIIDFRLFTFGFINDSDSLDRIRREQFDAAEQAEEQQPITQAPSSSGLSLDDLLIPNGIGALEQATYYSSGKIHEPQFISPSYLFFDPQPRHSLPYTNPKYPVYAHLMQDNTIPSSRGYSRSNSIPGYFEEALYSPIEHSKPYLPSIGYSVPYAASLSLLATRAEAYQRAKANLFAARPRVQGNDAYQGYALQLVPQTMKSPIFVKDESIKTDVPVRAYVVQQPYTMFTTPSAKLPQTTKAGMPKLDLLIKSTIPAAYQKPQSIQTYTSGEKYPASPLNQDLNPKKSNHIMQKYTSPKTDILNLTRNYDTHPKWVNVPSSGFWQTTHHYSGKATIKPNSIAVDEYKQKSQNLQEREEHNRQDESPSYKREAEIKPLADKDEATDAPEEQIKPKYEAKKKDNIEKTAEEKVKPDYKLKDDKKPYGKSSALAYAGAAAGIALLGGLASLASLPFRKKSRETERPNLQLVSNQPPDAQKPKHQTIDNVVGPPQNTETVFSSQLNADLTSIIINEAKQLGYDFSAMSLIKNSTGEYIGIGEDKNPKPAPSINKVAIAFAAAYLAQQKSIDLENLKIDFDPELDKDCILERELGRYAIFKEKGKISYRQLRELMLRESVNTSGDVILKYIGNGNMAEGQRIVEGVMTEMGLNNIKISHYLPDGEYLNGKTSTENAARLQSYIAQGKYLKPEYLKPIKEDLEHEKHLDFIRKKLGKGSGTKITFLKEGTGFAFHFDDYSGAVLFNDPKKPLWSDEVRDAMSIRRFETQTMSATRNLFDKIADMLQKYLVEQPYSNPKPA